MQHVKAAWSHLMAQMYWDFFYHSWANTQVEGTKVPMTRP